MRLKQNRKALLRKLLLLTFYLKERQISQLTDEQTNEATSLENTDITSCSYLFMQSGKGRLMGNVLQRQTNL